MSSEIYKLETYVEQTKRTFRSQWHPKDTKLRKHSIYFNFTISLSKEFSFRLSFLLLNPIKLVSQVNKKEKHINTLQKSKIKTINNIYQTIDTGTQKLLIPQGISDAQTNR